MLVLSLKVNKQLCKDKITLKEKNEEGEGSVRSFKITLQGIIYKILLFPEQYVSFPVGYLDNKYLFVFLGERTSSSH